ncbi:MAG: magnesium transporter, partial [Candidatus Omnitrophota bacterium]|jgi:magnesium transporter|nr:magnesium transporter [Candidatus Omnitrophota bacterium]
VFALFLPEIKERIRSRNFAQAKEIIKSIPSMDLAEGMKLLEDQEKVLVFKLLNFKTAIEVFESLTVEDQSYLLHNLENQEISEILNEMASDERADLFKDLTPKVFKKLTSLMKKEEVDDLHKLLKYPEDTAGSLMTTDLIELRPSMTAKKALLYLQENYKPGQIKDINSVYITDEQHKLLGEITLQMLIIAGPDMFIKDVMTPVDTVTAHALAPKIGVAKKFEKYDLLNMPVVDADNRLVGIITIDDVVELIHKETTKEIYEIGKMSPQKGEDISYAHTSVFDLIKRRAGWLMVLLVFDFLTGTVLKTFEHAMSSVIALTFFIPMLLDTGGNAGNQTTITIIRGFGTGDVTFKNAWKVIKLELSAALLMGVIVGGVAFGRAMLLQQSPLMAIVVGITMTTIVLLAILTGLFLPFLSKKIGLDPAALAGPITTSVVDIIGLIIYFKIAQAILPALGGGG